MSLDCSALSTWISESQVCVILRSSFCTSSHICCSLRSWCTMRSFLPNELDIAMSSTLHRLARELMCAWWPRQHGYQADCFAATISTAASCSPNSILTSTWLNEQCHRQSELMTDLMRWQRSLLPSGTPWRHGPAPTSTGQNCLYGKDVALQ